MIEFYDDKKDPIFTILKRRVYHQFCYSYYMRERTLRIALRTKREIISKFGYNPRNYTSIVRGEKIPVTGVEFLGNYSKPVSQEIFDPRSDQIRGHFFNAREIYRLKDIVVEPRQGALYTEDGKLISESTNWSTSNYYESYPWNPGRGIKKLHVKDLIVLTSNAFGHWLVEDLGSFFHLIAKFPNSPILVAQNHPKFVSDLIAYLGLSYITHDGPVLVDSIIMVTKQQDSGWMHPQDLQSLNLFKNSIGDSADFGAISKVYATRRNLRRSPQNEDEVEKLFSSFGYSILKLEEINFIDEIRLFRGVNKIAGVSGSWQFNSIWMQKGSEVIDIANENYWTELIHRVCEMKGITYKWEITEGTFDKEVSIAKLKKLLQES
jgi:hypothetical protein